MKIAEMEDLSGDKAHIYTVKMDADDKTLLEQFFDDNIEYEAELRIIFDKIRVMATETGCRRQYFTEGEGEWADGVVALKGKKLRLYGIYYNNSVVLFGSGGYKNVRAYQDNPDLNRKAQQVKYIAKQIYKGILERAIIIRGDGTIDDENWENDE